jgi:uncharacterized membrane protein
MGTEIDKIVHEVKESPWRLGVIYYNPDDQRLVVRHRIGFGWTLNMAKPMAWVVLAPLAVLLIRNLTHQSKER